jgi:hypothetical protein
LSWSALNGSAGNAYVRTTFDKFAKNRADAWSHRFRDHSSMLIQINTAALALSEVEATLAARCAVSLVVQASSSLVVASQHFAFPIHEVQPRTTRIDDSRIVIFRFVRSNS